MKKLIALIALIILSVFSGMIYAQFGGKTPVGSDPKLAKDLAKYRFQRNFPIAKNVGLAMLDYIQSHNGKYPDANKWEEELKPYWQGRGRFNVELIPQSGGSRSRLAMNTKVSGLPYSKVDEDSIIFFEMQTTQKDAHDDVSKYIQDVKPELKREPNSMFKISQTHERKMVVHGYGQAELYPFQQTSY